MLKAFFCNKKWAIWAWGGALFLFVSLYAQVQMTVMFNEWYRGFYDILGAATSHTIDDFWIAIIAWCHIAYKYILLAAFTAYFTRLYAFTWREAMTFDYIPRWKYVENQIEGAAQRIQQDTERFARIVETLGLQIVRAVMTLIAFLPILWNYSNKVEADYVTHIPKITPCITGIVCLIFLFLLGKIYKNKPKLPTLFYKKVTRVITSMSLFSWNFLEKTSSFIMAMFIILLKSPKEVWRVIIVNIFVWSIFCIRFYTENQYFSQLVVYFFSLASLFFLSKVKLRNNIDFFGQKVTIFLKTFFKKISYRVVIILNPFFDTSVERYSNLWKVVSVFFWIYILYFLKINSGDFVEGSLVWVSLMVSLGGMYLSWIIGYYLPKLEYNNQVVEAAYRQNLELISTKKIKYCFSTLVGLFTGVRTNYRRLYLHYGYFDLWVYAYDVGMSLVPFLVMAPGLFTGAISLGLLMQISNAFDKVHSGFSLFIHRWTTITELRSIWRRLHEFEASLPKGA